MREAPCETLILPKGIERGVRDNARPPPSAACRECAKRAQRVCWGGRGALAVNTGAPRTAPTMCYVHGWLRI